MWLRALLAAGIALAFAGSSAAQSVVLQFHDGRVTLRAEEAPVRTILAEWARLGGSTIVNGEAVAGPAVTLELTGVTERQALDVILRNVAGYMLAPRRAGSVGPSAFDRILILPASVAPLNPPPAPAAAVARPIPGRAPIPIRPPAAVGAADLSVDQVEESAADAGAETGELPTAGVPRPIPQPLVQPPQPITGVEIFGPDAVDESAQPADAGVAPTPANPFGVPSGSSSTPGIGAPAPQPRQPASNRVQ
jgi:hypothetical protein